MRFSLLFLTTSWERITNIVSSQFDTQSPFHFTQNLLVRINSFPTLILIDYSLLFVNFSRKVLLCQSFCLAALLDGFGYGETDTGNVEVLNIIITKNII
jgi:hypothetical protein